MAGLNHRSSALGSSVDHMNNILIEPTHRLANILLALFIAFPSLTFMDKRLGLTAAVVYAVVVAIALPTVIGRHADKLAKGMGFKGMAILLVVGLALLGVAFEIGYPIANSGRFGPGSDRDEALNQAVSALLAGNYPYYQKTYLGNPITPMPGSLILAAPFHWLLGNSSYQNLFWIGVFGLLLIGGRSSRPIGSILVFGLAWAMSPVLAQEFLTGGDMLANSLFVAVSSYWVIEALSNPDRSKLEMVASSVLLGICLSSRANFIVIVPIIFFAVARRRDYATALTYGALAALTLAALTAAFYLHDPAAFSPLHTASKLAKFNNLLPHAVLVVPLSTLAVSVLLGLYGNARHAALHMAIVLAIPVLASVILESIQASAPQFSSADFALPSLIFAILGHRVLRSAPI